MNDKKKIELEEDQLSEAAGGETVVIQPVGYKRCAADPSHLYVELLDACPVCGCRAFTFA